MRKIKLDELETLKLGLIHYIDSNEEDIRTLFDLGVIPGIEIRKISSVKICAEYIVEHTAGTVIIDNKLAKHIVVDELYEESV